MDLVLCPACVAVLESSGLLTPGRYAALADAGLGSFAHITSSNADVTEFFLGEGVFACRSMALKICVHGGWR
jgi:hypothetical protein